MFISWSRNIPKRVQLSAKQKAKKYIATFECNCVFPRKFPSGLPTGLAAWLGAGSSSSATASYSTSAASTDDDVRDSRSRKREWDR